MFRNTSLPRECFVTPPRVHDAEIREPQRRDSESDVCFEFRSWYKHRMLLAVTQS